MIEFGKQRLFDRHRVSVASRRVAGALAAAALLTSCGRQHAPTAAPPLLPQTSGTLALEGLSAPVAVVRDRWGVPHISAATEDDLFFAQGFVQAQDRLFQMDLWRRSVQGRLAEVLGPNFIERDVMTRRIQYDGDVDRDWAESGPQARPIARAFVRGINAWVAMARRRLPEEFRLAGWAPEPWSENDLLNRTDAFLQGRDVALEIMRARIIAAAGVRAVEAFLPSTAGPVVVPRDLDMATVSYGVADALRRVGTAPFFLSVRSGDRGGSNAWVIGGDRAAGRGPLLANDPHRRLTMPSLRYVVHLRAPGWNVIGATSPWLPGVAIGHNDRVAWAMTALDADTQDLFVERVNPVNAHQVQERGRWVDTVVRDAAIRVKGRDKPFAFRPESDGRGPVIAADDNRHLAFTLRWTGAQPGAAAELGAIAIDRARNAVDFRRALRFWRTPAVDVLYADIDGTIGEAPAGLAPERRGWNGAVPAPAWTGCCGWIGTRALSDAAPAAGRRDRPLISANGDAGRVERIRALLSGRRYATVEDSEAWQQDALAPLASRLVARLAAVRSERPAVESARTRLAEWDRRVSTGSSIATLYVLWEDALVRIAARRSFDAAVAGDYADLSRDVTTRALERIAGSGDRTMILAALESAVAAWSANGEAAWGALHGVLFKHPLAVTDPLQRRYTAGPFPIGGYDRTVMTVYGRGFEVQGGAGFREILEVGNWDRSVVTNAPGQSGSPASAHFRDLAEPWVKGEYFPLAFTDRAIQASAESMLQLIPAQR